MPTKLKNTERLCECKANRDACGVRCKLMKVVVCGGFSPVSPLPKMSQRIPLFSRNLPHALIEMQVPKVRLLCEVPPWMGCEISTGWSGLCGLRTVYMTRSARS